MSEILISELGLVGCGGAGFPAHVKFAATDIEHFIVNGAECEPLLHKDKEILHHLTAEFMTGLLKAMELTKAKRAHIAIKKKYADLVEHLEKSIKDPRISLLKLGDFYPSGDEYELVYEASKRLIPFGAIPLKVGCVVSNVETLLNLGRNKPVTTKFLSIAGAVPRPMTVEVPVGITFREAFTLAGLREIANMVFIDGGPMMGKMVDSVDGIVTKTCGGLIALPASHVLVQKMTRTDAHVRRISRSACDQCTDCSELCPRLLLGYPIHPHKAMRTAQLSAFQDPNYAIDSIFCCECGLCTLFSCPEDLPPREMAVIAKKFHLSKGVKQASFAGAPQIHPMRSARRVSIHSLIKKLGLLDFDFPAPLTQVTLRPEKVVLPLKMHVGANSVPCVKPGDRVTLGQKIAGIPEGKLGATLHASISGRIELVDIDKITIVKE